MEACGWEQQGCKFVSMNKIYITDGLHQAMVCFYWLIPDAVVFLIIWGLFAPADYASLLVWPISLIEYFCWNYLCLSPLFVVIPWFLFKCCHSATFFKNSVECCVYADDTRLYVTLKPADSDYISISDLRNWMSQNFLKLNKSKSDVLLFSDSFSPLQTGWFII